MQRCESGSPFDAFNLPNESIPQAGRNSGSAFEKSLPVHRSLLGGSERRSLEADCKPQKKNCAALAAWRVVLCSLSQQQRDYLKCGLENVLRMSPTRSLLCVLLGGADPVMRRVWTLACDCETRRCAAILRPVLPRAVGGAMSYVAAQQLRAFDLWHGYLASYSR